MAAAIQRPLRGSRISTFYPVKNLPSLASLDSAFQLQEYISLLIRYDVHDVDRIVTLPGSSQKDKEAGHDKEEQGGSAKDGDKSEVTVDEACWIYEQLRRLAQDLSHPLITTLQQECTRASCPEMKAGEWLYLCVAHGNDGAMEQCCAIDYILHTVDSATALLNSPRTFPSRLQIPQTSHRHFSSLARRLGRIFAHAYFHHREAFEQAEAESSLYARFLALTSKFDLVPREFLVIPSSHFSGDDGSDDDVPRAYADGRQHYPPQLRDEDHQLLEQHHQQDEHDANAQAEGSGSGSGSIGIGESPGAAAKARVTRPRTDTMIFTDAEASAVTDELAARRTEHEDEPEAPATARPGGSAEHGADEDEQFEIVLSPEETTRGPVEEKAHEEPVGAAAQEENKAADVAPALETPAPGPTPEAAVETPAGEPEKVEVAAPSVESEPEEKEELAVPASEAEETPPPEPAIEAPIAETKIEPESEPTPAPAAPEPEVASNPERAEAEDSPPAELAPTATPGEEEAPAQTPSEAEPETVEPPAALPSTEETESAPISVPEDASVVEPVHLEPVEDDASAEKAVDAEKENTSSTDALAAAAEIDAVLAGATAAEVEPAPAAAEAADVREETPAPVDVPVATAAEELVGGVEAAVEEEPKIEPSSES